MWAQTKTDSYTNFNLCFDDITHDINKKEGIDLEYFNSLYLDGIISSELAPILSGNVFTNVPSTLKYNNDFIIRIQCRIIFQCVCVKYKFCLIYNFFFF